jgi:two-component system sensor histidine kinase EvgS
MKNLEVKLFCDKALPRKFFSDPNRIRQIILNFLSNSLKFTMKGYIHLVAQYENEDKQIIKISVIDTGIGIAKKDQEIIF